MSESENDRIASLEREVHELGELIKGKKRDDVWIVRNWPIIMVAVAGIAWGVRLEERFAAHVQRPWHDGMQSTDGKLIEIQAELRYLRQSQEALMTQFDELEKKMMP